MRERVAELMPRLVRAVRRALPRRYYTDPQGYWEQRHRTRGLSFEGVGRLHMSEEANVADYETKWAHLDRQLKSARETGALTLFDAGCGTGWLTERAVGLGFAVEARDFSATAIELARSRSVADLIAWSVGPLHTIRVGRTFDVVMCVDVLFHVVDDTLWRQSVEALESLARPDGLLLVQEHLVEVESPAVADGTTHTRWRTLADYTRVLRGSQLLERDTYWLEGEQQTKDLLAFRRHG